MTNVQILKNNGNIIGFVISGHSGYAEAGSDIVCSAISTLSQSICVGLENASYKESKKTDYLLKVCNRYIEQQLNSLDFNK